MYVHGTLQVTQHMGGHYPSMSIMGSNQDSFPEEVIFMS